MHHQEENQQNFLTHPIFTYYVPYSGPQSMVSFNQRPFQPKSTMQLLEERIRQYEEQVTGLKKQLKQCRKNKLCRRCHKSRAYEQKQGRPSLSELPARKTHLKNIECPVEGCERRYSSNAALRHHIKKSHAFKAEQEARR